MFADAYRIIAGRFPLVVAVLVVGAVAAFVGFKISKPTFSATATVMMDANGTLGSSVSNGSFLGNDMPALLTGDTVLSRFAKQQHLEMALRDVRKHITADVTPYSAVMPITYTAASASEAIAGANGLADDLHQYYRELATRRYDDLASYLSTALDGERAKIETADGRLARLIATDPYLTQSDAAQAIGAQLLALDQQRDAVDATMQSHEVAARLSERRIGDLAPTIKSELRNADLDYSTLAAQVAKDRAADAVLRAQYTDRYAGIRSLEAQIARSNATLAQERSRAEGGDPGNSATYGQLLRDRDTAAAVYAGDRAQLASIERQVEAAESHLAALPNVGVKIAAIRRDRDAATTAYQILAEQRTFTLAQQAESAALGSITVVDRATVAAHTISRIGLLVAAATMVAFVVLAATLPLLVELLDERLRRRVTIEALYGRPLIGRVTL